MIGPLTIYAKGMQGQAGERLAALRDEALRRTALARLPCPEGVRGPPLRLLLGEFGTAVEEWRERKRWKEALAASGALAPASPVSQPVVLLPGFGAHPFRMRHLRRALEGHGHRVSDWGMGWNLGTSEELFATLIGRVEAIARREDQPVTLVGWSLGGLFAREVAKRLPDRVAMVITMGSPFSGDLHANNAWRAYHLITGQTVDKPPIPCNFAEKPPMPTFALWSPRDGVVQPRASCGRKGERDRAISVRCTHLGFAGHPQVARTVADLLAGIAPNSGEPN